MGDHTREGKEWTARLERKRNQGGEGVQESVVVRELTGWYFSFLAWKERREKTGGNGELTVYE